MKEVNMTPDAKAPHFIFRDTDIERFRVLRSRGQQWQNQREHGYSDGRGHGPGGNHCYACSLAASNPEAGCIVHGIESRKIEKSSDVT